MQQSPQVCTFTHFTAEAPRACFVRTILQNRKSHGLIFKCTYGILAVRIRDTCRQIIIQVCLIILSYFMGIYCTSSPTVKKKYVSIKKYLHIRTMRQIENSIKLDIIFSNLIAIQNDVENLFHNRNYYLFSKKIIQNFI